MRQRVAGSMRAEAAERGVPYSQIRRERAQPRIDPKVGQRIRYYTTVLRLNPAAVAAQIGITEADVVKVLASDPPAEPVSAPMVPRKTACITQPSIIGPMESVSLSADPDRSPAPSIYSSPAEPVRLSY